MPRRKSHRLETALQISRKTLSFLTRCWESWLFIWKNGNIFVPTALKKINSLWIKKLNMTSVILKLLQENQRIFLTSGKYFSFFKRLFIYLEDTVTETGE